MTPPRDATPKGPDDALAAGRKLRVVSDDSEARLLAQAQEVAGINDYGVPHLRVDQLRRQITNLQTEATGRGRKSVLAELAQLLRTLTGAELLSVGPQWPADPVDLPLPDLDLPPGLVLLERGIYSLTARESDAELAWRWECPPMLSCGILRGDSGEVSIQLAYRERGRWRAAIVSRDTILTTRLITDLANLGVTISSVTAKNAVKTQERIETRIFPALPEGRLVEQVGWQGDGSFLLAEEIIGPDGRRTPTADAGSVPVGELRPGGAYFIDGGTSAGRRQIVDALRPSGTLEGALEVLSLAAGYWVPQAVIAASLSSPLLQVLGCPPYVMDVADRTSRGKTTVLRLAMSIWGCVDEHAPSSLIASWNTTPVGLAERTRTLRHVPVAMDDTQTACLRRLAQMIYDHTQGRDRQRGHKDGSRITGSWQCPLLSTGEAELVALAGTQGGIHGRVLQVAHPPFDAGKADLVTAVNLGVMSHYGTVGPEWVAWVQRHREHWDSWRQAYRERATALRQGVSTEVVGRLADYVAALAMTADLVARALPHLYLDLAGSARRLWEHVIERAGVADVGRTALELAVNLALANRHRFYSLGDESQAVPHSGWWGRWDIPGGSAVDIDTLPALYWTPEALREALEGADFTYEAIVRDWRDRGWLSTDSAHRGLTSLVRLRGARARMVSINSEAVAEVSS